MQYRVKHIINNDSPIIDLMAFIFMPILLWGKDKRPEWWDVQCRLHWWNSWHTCMSYGGYSIDGDTEEKALQKLHILKQHNVGYYDFFYDYDDKRNFYIKETFDIPKYKLKPFEINKWIDTILIYGAIILLAIVFVLLLMNIK